DPFKVSEIHRDAHPLTFTMPGSNVRYKGANNVKDGFRTALFEQLAHAASDGGRRSIAQVLLDLEGEPIVIERCPSLACGSGPFVFQDDKLVHECDRCGSKIYVTDTLRLHEGIS